MTLGSETHDGRPPVDDQIVTDREGHRFQLRPVHCPTCGPTPTRFLGLRGGEHHRYGLGVPSRIVRCTKCGVIFPDPFPFPLDAGELYGDPDKYFERSDLHEESRKLAEFRRIARELLERSRTPTPSALDVGSGRGEFLHAAQLEGIRDLVGLELSEAMADRARQRYGVAVELETIEQHAERSGRTYDAIVMAAVLEHVHDPDSMMNAAARLSRTGTVLYLDLPVEPCLLTMVGNVAGRVTGGRTVLNLSPTFPPYHVFGFNPRSLRILLAKHGFQMEACRVWAAPRLPARPDMKDRIKAFAATQVNRLANLTRTAANMNVWARAA